MTISTDDRVWLSSQLEATEKAITAINRAIVELAGGAQSYELDTGQSRQRVTRADLGSLVNSLTKMLELRSTYRTQLGHAPTQGRQVRVIPDF